MGRRVPRDVVMTGMGHLPGSGIGTNRRGHSRVSGAAVNGAVAACNPNAVRGVLQDGPTGKRIMIAPQLWRYCRVRIEQRLARNPYRAASGTRIAGLSQPGYDPASIAVAVAW